MGKFRGVISAGHELTARAGEEILHAGGNAYDAVIAAVAAACVTEPILASLAGGGFLLAKPADRASVVYDFFVQTPARLKPQAEMDFFATKGDFGDATQIFHIGKASAAVPGKIKGIFEIHANLCSMDMKDLLAPAIRYAREGVEITPYQAFLFGVLKALFVKGPRCMEIYGSREKDGELVQEGEVLYQPEMADFLEVLAHEGADLFYRGEAGQALGRQMQDGGLITLQDLENYKVLRCAPLKLEYRDVLIETNPPPSTGGVLVAFGLKCLEDLDLSSLKQDSADYLLRLADILERSLHARDALRALEDPGQWEKTLLAEAFIKKYRPDIAGRPAAKNGTTQISVVDKDHNMASMTVSNGQINNHIIPGTGVILNNILGEEWLNPDGFHSWVPDTRMSSMMAPTTASWPDGRCIAIGSGGCDRLRTAILQVLVNLIDFKMNAPEAVGASRIHIEDDVFNIEGGFQSALEPLLEAYPQHLVWESLNMYFGGAHIAGIDERGYDGAGDSRRSGACVVL